MGLNREDLAARVAASCVASGVPLRVADAGAVARVAVLLGAETDGPQRRPEAEHAAGRRRSQQPGHLDAVGVEHLGAAPPGLDGDAADQGAADSGLPVEVEGGPSAA